MPNQIMSNFVTLISGRTERIVITVFIHVIIMFILLQVFS